jgi:hypothetical protein
MIFKERELVTLWSDLRLHFPLKILAACLMHLKEISSLPLRTKWCSPCELVWSSGFIAAPAYEMMQSLWTRVIIRFPTIDARGILPVMSYLISCICYKCYHHNYHCQNFLTQIDCNCITMARAGTCFGGESLTLRISLLCSHRRSLYRLGLCKRVNRKLFMDKSLRIPLPVTYCERFYKAFCSAHMKKSTQLFSGACLSYAY